MTKSQQYNCLIRNGGNAIPKYTCPEAKVSNPPTYLTLLWACNQFRVNSNNWHVSLEATRQIISKSIRALMYQNVTNKSVVTANNLTTGRWIFFMIFLPQDIIFCSVHIVWHTALLKPLDDWGEMSFQPALIHCSSSASFGLMFPAVLGGSSYTAVFPHTDNIVDFCVIPCIFLQSMYQPTNALNKIHVSGHPHYFGVQKL